MGYGNEMLGFLKFNIAKDTLAGVYTFFGNLLNDLEICEGL